MISYDLVFCGKCFLCQMLGESHLYVNKLLKRSDANVHTNVLLFMSNDEMPDKMAKSRTE